jgi:16S rRNA (uracil1498-N3)-methyltransferase
MSKPPRFFITPDQVHGPQIVVSGDDLRHIRMVLRKQPGDMLSLLDGQGREYTARIVLIERSAIVTEIVSESRREIRHPLVTLGQGLPKSDKLDWIVQKATELGASSIVPLITERTIVKVKDEGKRVGRWQKIAREAAMQSNRPDIPCVEGIQKFSGFLQSLSYPPMPPFAKGGKNIISPPLEKGDRGGFSQSDTLLLLPWEEGTKPIKAVLRAHQNPKNIIVLIGPEGGFTAVEAGMAKEKGFHAVSLGPNILRTETAAMAVLSIILYEYL